MPATYCNPLDLGYGYAPAPNFAGQGAHRATADPCIAVLDGVYYLFSTNQWGYWWSADLADWHFVARRFLRAEHQVFDDLCAPAVFVRAGALHVLGSTYTRNFPIWRSENPQVDDWHEATPALGLPAWDPAFLIDEDGDGTERLYFYYGSSNDKPIYGRELDPDTFAPLGDPVELIRLHPDAHGWERFGEYHDNTFLSPFIEGAWVTKHAGHYYLQYGAPGTEFSGYADGVYVSDSPLGEFVYQPHNPLSARPGGFARGAGHGGTHQDVHGNYWHVSTVAIGVKNNFERRIGMWPAGFTPGAPDLPGTMYCNTAYGDYPILLPTAPDADHRSGRSAGWMLLSGFRPVSASSTLGPARLPAFAVDESMKTWWSAASGDAGEWLAVDLGSRCRIHAVQLNYADQDAEILGHPPGLRHRYYIETSEDAHHWTELIDRRSSQRDAPHAYHELPTPVRARHVRVTNIEVPSGKFAVMGLRVFGVGPGAPPAAVAEFTVLRAADQRPVLSVPSPAPADETRLTSVGGTRAKPGARLGHDPADPNSPVPLRTGWLTPGSETDRRGAWIKWRSADDAVGHVIYWGVRPDELFSSVMVYNVNEYWCSALDRDRAYWFAVEAFNTAGVGPRTTPTFVA